MNPDSLALFDAVTRALRREDWPAVASLCDPASLTRFKRQLLEQFESADSHRLTVEQYMRHQPDMPREVAEHYVANHNRWADPTRRFADDLPGLTSTSELRERSAVDVFAAWLEGRSQRHQLQRLVAAEQISPEVAAELKHTALPEPRYIALGMVPDGENLSHILFRLEFQGADSGVDADAAAWMDGLSPHERALAEDLSGREHLQITTCRRQPGGEWRILAGYDLLGLGSRTFAVGGEEATSSDNDVTFTE